LNTTLRQSLALFIAPALLGLALLAPDAQAETVRGSGKAATETRNLAEFQAIGLNGSMDLTVRQGATQSVQVEADDNLLPLLETVVESGSNGATLQVRWAKGKNLYTRSKVHVTVVVPKLTALASSGSGDLTIESFNTPALKLAISGSSDARMNSLTVGDLVVSISGSGDVAANGSAGKVMVSIAGSGDVRLADLKADDVSVTIAGSGDAAVNAAKTLDVRIAGSGDVTYGGNPALTTSISGSGEVRRR
jgi:hypothetical protein